MTLNETLRARIDEYINELFAPEDEVLQWIRREIEHQGMPAIHIKPYEGRLLQMLALLGGARKIVEIGALAGYSGVWLARALPPDGVLYTLEIDAKHARVARNSFQRAGLSERIQLIEGPAQDSLETLQSKGPFDFVFIDADKVGYPAYLAWAVENLRPGGVVTAHNALRRGNILEVIEPESEDDRAIIEFNRAMATNPQLESVVIAVGDGMALGIKKR